MPARSALVGNPSDGFGGATIAFAVPSLRASVAAAQAEAVIIDEGRARISFRDAAELVAAGEAGAYPAGGPLALAMAAAKRLCERARGAGSTLDGLGFELRVSDSTIPPRVGLAGSSAIVIGVLRALGELLGHPPELDELPGLALACETTELGVAAGLQDRVVQAHGGLAFMEFGPVNPSGYRREALDPALLPPLLIAWLANAGTDSGATHHAVLDRFAAGDREVTDAMAEIAALARAARTALLEHDRKALGALMARNFDLRRRIYPLDPRHVRLIETAREHGLAANYTGSGGAIVVLAHDADRTARLRTALARGGCDSLLLG